MAGEIVVGVATIYMVGAYVAAFLAGRFNWDQADAIVIFWPVALGFVAVIMLAIGPVLGGVMIYHLGQEMRGRI